MKDSIILVTNNGLGNADIPLQQKLAVKYFELLSQNNELPSAICFYNTEGVIIEAQTKASKVITI
ncbi:hypothetical protein [Candidatus Villigracilis saccharophilus]|uniref:hypothetical protein n=1 Tax=Candidatus Villigracilis saccharophilus TaxID=3140684 RepID=UPI003134FB6E|nr:hypothetical protein [Anaerolineales bacterium]